jgi:O-antigen/teichoic acid export membrane protein
MLARFCGADQLGRYALGFSIFVLIEILHQAFVSAPFNVFSQGLSRHQLRKYTGSSLVLVILISILGAILFCSLAVHSLSSGDKSLAKAMFVLSFFVFFNLMREFARRYCFACQHLKSVVIIDGACSILQLSLMYALLQQNSLGPASTHASIGIASAFVMLLLLPVVARKVAFDKQAVRKSIHQNWDFGRWVFVTQVTSQLSWSILQWIIAINLSKEATGLYTGYLSIVFLSNPVLLGISNLLFPMLAREHRERGDSAMVAIAVKAAGMISILMTSLLCILIVFGQEICDFLYDDPAYVSASLMLGILGSAICVLAISTPFDGGMHARRRSDLSSIASCVGFAVTVIWALLFVSWGMAWAAGGLLLGCLAESVLRIYLFYKYRSAEARKTCASTSFPLVVSETT